jgi:penicillin-binding protein 1A
MKIALADKPAIPFRVPAGIKLIRVDARSGMRAGPGDGGRTILEAFKPGTAPPDNYSIIGVADADGRGGWGSGGGWDSGGGGDGYQQQPDMGRSILRPGTGGLY